MSELKDKAKNLKEISKKYGYDLKHTHALEIISQLDLNVNRHVALKKEKESQSFFGLDFSKAPLSINVPFFEGFVIEIVERDESVNFIITDERNLDLELLMEADILNIKSFRFLTEDEVKKPGFSFRISKDDEEDLLVPFKTLFDWIMHRAKEEKCGQFLLYSRK